MPIAWRDTLSLREPHVDHQHKSILNTINTLEKAVNNADSAVIFTIFSNVVPYLRKHFKEEEAYFEEIKFPRMDWHRRLHADLLTRAEDVERTFKRAADDEARIAAAKDLQVFLSDYVSGHVLTEDMKAKPYVKLDPSSKVSMLVLHEKSEEEHKLRKTLREKDVEYHLPSHLAHLTKRIEFVVPDMPAPQSGYETFEALCESAIFRRLDRVLLFFQRYNPELRRELPPFFLSSPHFREKFQAALRALVLPTLWESRQVRLASASLDISKIDNESFWAVIEPTLRSDIMQWWKVSWDSMKPVVGRRQDGGTVLKVREALKRLREMLEPDEPEHYDLPRIAARELGVFVSLLDVETDWWDKLTVSWKIFVDLYEQEKHPRVFQQKAREGALRDFMLESFNRYPIEWLDFILLACHYAFPRVTTVFLERFTTNYDNRDVMLPYTMRYLDLVKARPEIRRREIEEENLYQEEREELRKFLTGRQL
jgi:hemerythrin-like metal-binding protein